MKAKQTNKNMVRKEEKKERKGRKKMKRKVK